MPRVQRELEAHPIDILDSSVPLHKYEKRRPKLPHAPARNPLYENWDQLPRLTQNAPNGGAGNRMDVDRSPTRRRHRPEEEGGERPRLSRPDAPRARRGRPIRAPVLLRQHVPSSDSGSDSSDEGPLATRRPPPSAQRQQNTTRPVVSSTQRQPALRPRPTADSPRQKLERAWQAICRAQGAAPVTIASSRGDEVPFLEPGFKYLESEYMLGNGVAAPEDGFVASCSCGIVCNDAELCECQEDAALAEDEDVKTFAYDRRKFFKFDRPFNALVVECSKNCQCDRTCQNRVAQLPRDVPVQIFKTGERGWGVRSPSNIPKGKVLGLYTGKLITRVQAMAINADSPNRSYVFDLDALEDTEAFEDARRFSIDAYKQGNWTRFVNHSCEPNVEVYPVAWDTHPSMNRFYLAFVATRNIAANTELTIDYDPKAARDKKGKRRQRNGEKPCKCGVANCRGWIAV